MKSLCVYVQELPAAEEVCVTLPEEAELQPVGTVSSILHKIGKRQFFKNLLSLKLWTHFVFILHVHLLSYCPVSEGHSSSERRQHPLYL